MSFNSDPFGQAVLDYYLNRKASKLTVLCDGFDEDVIPVDYLFRSFQKMPKMEQAALENCKGKILDVGAGSGCHALWLQKKGLDVTALEQSALCIDVMKKRGVIQTMHQNFYAPIRKKYDTLLLLMNGTGIAGNLKNFPPFLIKLKELLSTNGQILIDSSDLIYLFQEEDGSANLPLNGKYYGELEYKFKYKNVLSEPFPWLFIDKDLFAELAHNAGFTFEIVNEGENYDYLAKLTLNTF